MKEIFEAISKDETSIVALPNAIIDNVINIPLTAEEYAKRVHSGEARIDCDQVVRIGGGGINFALAASSVGKKRVHFAGFLGPNELELLGSVNFQIYPIIHKRAGNTVIELSDGNHILSSSYKYSNSEIRQLVEMTINLKCQWIALCSFSMDLAFALLTESNNFFLDSGYGESRKSKETFARRIDPNQTKKYAKRQARCAIERNA